MTSDSGSAAPPVKLPRYLIAIMFLTYALSYLDRQIVNIVAEHIKRDLGLADWQVGAMSGLAFALLYTTIGLPIARLAERKNRAKIIAVSLVVWSGCTALFGLGRNFAEIFLARLGVGMGEAGGVPPATSLISDSTPKSHQSRALAFYNLGVPLGALLGMVIGGFVVDLWGWRTAFLLVGLPGIPLAALIYFTIGDPRDAVPKADRRSTDVPSLKAVFASLRGKPAFWWIVAGSSLTTFVGYGQQAFFASFFLRNHGGELDRLAGLFGMSKSTGLLGVALGLGLGIGGALGSYVGGQFGDRWKSPNAYVYVPAIGSLLAFPLYAAVLLAPSTLVALLLIGVPTFMKSLWYGPTYAALNNMSHARSRATVIAIFLFIINAVGLGLGPVAIGMVSDFLGLTMGTGDGLRWALIMASFVSVLSALCFFQARKSLVRDML